MSFFGEFWGFPVWGLPGGSFAICKCRSVRSQNQEGREMKTECWLVRKLRGHSVLPLLAECPTRAPHFPSLGNPATTASPFGAQPSTCASPFASATTAPSASPFAAGASATGASPFATSATTTPSPFGQTAQTASPFSQGVQTAGPSPFTSSQASPFAAPSSNSPFAPKASVSQSRPSQSQFAQTVQASAAAASPFGSSKAPSPFLSAPTNGANCANGVSGAQAGHGRSTPSTASAPPVAANQASGQNVAQRRASGLQLLQDYFVREFNLPSAANSLRIPQIQSVWTSQSKLDVETSKISKALLYIVSLG